MGWSDRYPWRNLVSEFAGMNTPAIGGYWEKSSFIWGESAGKGEIAQAMSPLGFPVQSIRLLDESEISSVFQYQGPIKVTDVSAPILRLRQLLHEQKDFLASELRVSMGFVSADCDEMIEGCISLLDRFSTTPSSEDSYAHQGRKIGVSDVPRGTIAAVLPQNAAFYMGLIVYLNAICSGNRVILRTPSGSYRLMAIFGELLSKAGFNPKSYCIVACDAKAFINECQSATHPILIHYFGSSQRAGDLLATTFNSGHDCLIDGEGNTWAYIDEDQNPDHIAEVVWRGAVRYNGQTCTSINGVVVHPNIASDFRKAILGRVASTDYGIDETADVGPLFGERQVESIEALAKLSKGRISRRGASHKNVASPLLVEDPDEDSEIVGSGLFGPALWVREGRWSDFVQLWRKNRYPLCASVFTDSDLIQAEAVHLPSLARLVLNGDPSLEDPLEPWGAYGRCGSNRVSDWPTKYQRQVQVDRPE